MSYALRKTEPRSDCHVTGRSGGRALFHDRQDYLEFIDLLQTARDRYRVGLYGYCLMVDHVHLVINVACGNLDCFMLWLQASYTRRYQRRYGGDGKPWANSVEVEPVEDDEEFVRVLRHIEANPIRAGLVTSALEYPWSSHRVTALTLGTGDVQSQLPWLDRLPVKVPTDWTARIDEQKEIGALMNTGKA